MSALWQRVPDKRLAQVILDLSDVKEFSEYAPVDFRQWQETGFPQNAEDAERAL